MVICLRVLVTLFKNFSPVCVKNHGFFPAQYGNYVQDLDVQKFLKKVFASEFKDRLCKVNNIDNSGFLLPLILKMFRVKTDSDWSKWHGKRTYFLFIVK
jgi:hypothetical protein